MDGSRCRGGSEVAGVDLEREDFFRRLKGMLLEGGGIVESQKVRYSKGASDDSLIANPSLGVGLARVGDALSFDL